MKHVSALLIKFAMITVLLEIVLSMLTNLSFTEILYISITVTIVAYIVGDLIILPLSNNTTATISDVILALFTIYAFNYFYYDSGLSFIDSLVAAAILGVGEWIFHKYVVRNILPERK